MHRFASKRIAQAGLDVELVGLSAEDIPLDDASFDCVVVTYTLCSIPDPALALREMRRVLKAGGRVLFCEHGRAPDEGVRRWQDRLTRYWKTDGIDFIGNSKISSFCQNPRQPLLPVFLYRRQPR